MGLLTAWANDSEAVRQVVLELRLPYLPNNQNPRPIGVSAVSFDLGFKAGESDAFDLPSGRTVFEREFQFPVDGHLLAVGGHLHDYGKSLSLVDVASGKTLTSLRPTLDQDGKVTGMGREILGAAGDGLRVRAGRRYRLVAVYENPQPEAIADGAMAVLAVIFAPDDPRAWPPVDPSDPQYQADLSELERLGMVMAAPVIARAPPQ